MIDGSIRIEKLEQMPERGGAGEYMDVFVRLGCLTCSEPVCLVIRNIGSISPSHARHPEEATYIRDALGEVDKQEHRGASNLRHLDSCGEGPCPHVEAKEFTLDLLHDRFESDLRPTPQE